MEKDPTRKLTVREFFKLYPDDATCLQKVMEVRFGLRHDCGKCGVVGATFHRLENRKAFACAQCGDNLYPCAGTIFEDSRTSLQVWFYAIYLFTVSRNGVTAKELERALGVTYKTAWRVARQIRTLMEKADGGADTILFGHIESNEAFVGGVARGKGRRAYPGANKTVVLGLKQCGWRLIAKVISNVTTDTLRAAFGQYFSKGSTVSTDEAKAYSLVGNGGRTRLTVNHSEKEYAYRDWRAKEAVHVNSVENFWRLFKASTHGTHIHVSKKHMDKYLGEFT